MEVPTQPGIYENLPFQIYVQIDAVNASYLKLLSEVPAKAKLPDKDSKDKRFGRAVHAYVLEGKSTFFREFAVAGKVDKRTKEGKAKWAEFERQSEGKTVLDSSDYGIIMMMNDAVEAHPFAGKLLHQGRSEVTVVWRDVETGLLCKCRPDRIPANTEGVFLDLKSTKNAGEFIFRRDCVHYKYYNSAAWYMEGLGIATGKLYTDFAFIAVEKEPPYRVEVYTLEDKFLARGYDENHHWLAKEKEYREQNFWPHYKNPGAIELFKPQYLEGEFE